MLAKRKNDIAFIRPPRNSGGLESTKVHREGLVALLPPGSPLRDNADIRIADLEDESYSAGPIALQNNGGLIRFRAVQVKPL